MSLTDLGEPREPEAQHMRKGSGQKAAEALGDEARAPQVCRVRTSLPDAWPNKWEKPRQRLSEPWCQHLEVAVG